MIHEFKSSHIETPLGAMLAIADEKALYLLEFVDGRGVENEVEKLRLKFNAAITPGAATPLLSIKTELQAYFDGLLQVFKTPLQFCGSTFQKSVWDELLRIPYGQTRSYLEQAKAIGKPTGYRAVANANGANQLAIVVPCHRIINNNGNLGGYGGGIHRKDWLIAHENNMRPLQQRGYYLCNNAF